MGKHLIQGHIIAECLNRVLISKTLHFFLPLSPIHTIHDACALLCYLSGVTETGCQGRFFLSMGIARDL
jgi:hypothetical protein